MTIKQKAKKIHPYEPVILKDEEKAYNKWMMTGLGTFPYKHCAKSYVLEIGESLDKLVDCGICRICQYYKEIYKNNPNFNV